MEALQEGHRRPLSKQQEFMATRPISLRAVGRLSLDGYLALHPLGDGIDQDGRSSPEPAGVEPVSLPVEHETTMIRVRDDRNGDGAVNPDDLAKGKAICLPKPTQP